VDLESPFQDAGSLIRFMMHWRMQLAYLIERPYPHSHLNSGGSSDNSSKCICMRESDSPSWNSGIVLVSFCAGGDYCYDPHDEPHDQKSSIDHNGSDHCTKENPCDLCEGMHSTRLSVFAVSITTHEM
jgi:hypothetical protein